MRAQSGWLFLVAAMALGVSLPAGAAGAPAASQGAAVASSQLPAGSTSSSNQVVVARHDPHQIICKQGQPPVGSRLGGSSICHTRAQWNQISWDAQKHLHKMQMIGMSGG